MLYVAHRINTVKQLDQVPREYGIEIDLRDFGNRIVLQHDPFVCSEVEDFETLLESYHHGLIILNIKSERIEGRVLELLQKYSVENYFFLDSSFPMMRSLAAQGIREMAIRFSEFEPIEYALAMKGTCDWVWIDCFTKMPLDQSSYEKLRQHFKLCVVSPELQGRPIETIPGFAEELVDYPVDAVCTKRPDLWKESAFWGGA